MPFTKLGLSPSVLEGVCAAGYITPTPIQLRGIPLVLALAEAGLRVNVNDLNQTSLNTLESGRLPFIESGAEEVLAKALAGKRLVFTNSSNRISTSGPVIITIGTPIDEFLNPVRRVVQDCIDAMLPSLADGQLLVLRSTVFLKNMDDFAAMNAVYAKYFKTEPPARSTVEVARLPKDVLLEIDVIAQAE